MKSRGLQRLYDAGTLSDLDIHFARFMGRLDESEGPELLLAAALASSHTREGHTCLDLSKLGGRELAGGGDGDEPCLYPETGLWQEMLKKRAVVGRPGEFKPLILDGQFRLYLYRYWNYQQVLANFVNERVGFIEEDMEEKSLADCLKRLFGDRPDKEIDWQKVAALVAVMMRFCVISGGPGTGKTTTISKILALIVEQSVQTKPRIGLAAPTGKAAARLQEAIKHSKEGLNCSDAVKEAIPEEASTIHRLLGSTLGSPYFRHNSRNKLPVDVVVVDEASMVDLALMSKLVQALHSKARLILLGDKDQLASVEAGAVLGDMCDTGNIHSFSSEFCKRVKRFTGHTIDPESVGEGGTTVRDHMVLLQRNFRFGDDSGIGAVSRAVNKGDADLAVRLLGDSKHKDIAWRDLMSPAVLLGAIKDRVVQGYGDYLKSTDIGKTFDVFNRFRMLCAVRQGPYGVSAMNLLVEQILKGEGLIEPDKKWYHGRPILITSNDYNLRLFNGDVGMILPDPAVNGELRAFFPFPDGSVRTFHPLRLPEHETVYAMTVHKSQGSEFDEVLLLLPDRDSPVLTRELVYTAITRARGRVEIWATEAVFRRAVSRRIERMSGLRDAVWGER